MPDARDKKYSDLVRNALLLARKDHELREMAESIGCSRQTLGPFLGGGRMGVRLLRKAEQWARTNGYWVWDDLQTRTSYPAALIREAYSKYPTSTEYWNGLAQELRTIADIIESGAFDDLAKFARVESCVTFLGRVLSGARKLVEEDQRSQR